MEAPDGDHEDPEILRTTELPGESLRPNKYPPRTGSIILLVARTTLDTRLHRTLNSEKKSQAGFLNSPGDFCCLDYPR